MFLVELSLSRLCLSLRLFIGTHKIWLQIRDIRELMAQKFSIIQKDRNYQIVCSVVHTILGHDTKWKTIGIFPLIPISSVPDLSADLMQSLKMDTNEHEKFILFLRKK